jgi:hypothetical protein
MRTRECFIVVRISIPPSKGKAIAERAVLSDDFSAIFAKGRESDIVVDWLIAGKIGEGVNSGGERTLHRLPAFNGLSPEKNLK